MKILTEEAYIDYFKDKSQIRIIQSKTAQDNYVIIVFKITKRAAKKFHSPADIDKIISLNFDKFLNHHFVFGKQFNNIISFRQFRNIYSITFYTCRD